MRASKKIITVNNITQNFCWIPAGNFLMGSPAEEPERWDDETQHEVILTKGYWLADTQVTQELWKAVMGDNPSYFQGNYQLPVERVSWDDCQEFLQKINGMVPELNLRLPTEAEWEYACRAGTATPFSFGENITPAQVNYYGRFPYANGDPGLNRNCPVPVKSLPANSWGLYEMHGNVLEWCSDWYGDYPSGSTVDPTGPDRGGSRMLRGGCWFNIGRDVRSAYRFGHLPGYRHSRYGFRLCAANNQQNKHKGGLPT